MIKRIAALVAALTFSVGFASVGSYASTETTEELTPTQKLSPYVEPGVVYLEVKWQGKVWDKNFKAYIRDAPFVSTFQCTGFVLTEDGYIGTAAHCVEKTNDRAIAIMNQALEWVASDPSKSYGAGYFANKQQLIQYAELFWAVDGEKVGQPDRAVNVSWGADVSGLEAAKTRPARIIASQKFTTGDTALLKVEATGLNAMPLAESTELDTGTEIASVGFPVAVDTVTDPDYTPSIKTGTVSSKKTVSGGLLSVYEIDAAVSGGMSGGPTVNLDGEVVGINSFKITDESQPFNFVQPVSHLVELLNGAGVTPELSETTIAYRKGLDAYFAGDKVTAVKNLEQVTKEQPANGFARDYLLKAEDLPDPKPKEKDSDVPVVPIAIAALLLAAAAGAFFFMKSRKVGPFKESPETPSNAPTAMTGVVQPPESSDGASGFCDKCGTPRSGGKFCTGCGAQL